MLPSGKIKLWTFSSGIDAVSVETDDSTETSGSDEIPDSEESSDSDEISDFEETSVSEENPDSEETSAPKEGLRIYRDFRFNRKSSRRAICIRFLFLKNYQPVSEEGSGAGCITLRLNHTKSTLILR